MIQRFQSNRVISAFNPAMRKLIAYHEYNISDLETISATEYRKKLKPLIDVIAILYWYFKDEPKVINNWITNVYIYICIYP